MENNDWNFWRSCSPPLISRSLFHHDFLFLIITRHHELGHRRNIAEILPTSLPELPAWLRDLRNEQKSLKTYFLYPLYSLYIPLHCLQRDYSQTLILLNLIVVNLLLFSNFARNGSAHFRPSLVIRYPYFFLKLLSTNWDLISSKEDQKLGFGIWMKFQTQITTIKLTSVKLWAHRAI